MTKRWIVVLAVSAMSLIPLGCAEDEDTPESSAPSKEEFVAEASRLCADFADRRAAAVAETSDDPVPTREAVAEVVSEYRDLISDLRSLDFPTEDAETIDHLFDNAAAAADEIDAAVNQIDPEATAGGGISVVADPTQAFSQAIAALGAYGLEACAQS